MRPIALTIAGSDSSGGAGIQADLKTFSAFGVYGASVVTAVTAQNTHGVAAVHAIPADVIRAQLRCVASDLDVKAVKTGMLGDAATVEAVVEALETYALGPLVVDPVMVATSGDALIAEAAIEAIRTRLVPRATLLTPNLMEAARLLDVPLATSHQQMAEQAQALLERGPAAVLVKGGHLDTAVSGNRRDQAIDVLATPDGILEIPGRFIETRQTHGTGCTLSAATAALLARGTALEAAIRQAKAYLIAALEAGSSLAVGTGQGPVDHLVSGPWK